MIQPLVAWNGIERGGGPPRLVDRPENEPFQSRQDDGAGTHGTGFQRDVQGAVRQMLGAERFAGGRQGQGRGVGRGGAELFDAIATAPDDLIVLDDHGANWQFPRFEGPFGFSKGVLHPSAMRSHGAVLSQG